MVRSWYLRVPASGLKAMNRTDLPFGPIEKVHLAIALLLAGLLLNIQHEAQATEFVTLKGHAGPIMDVAVSPATPPAPAPIAMLALPVVQAVPAKFPIATLKEPLELSSSAL